MFAAVCAVVALMSVLIGGTVLRNQQIDQVCDQIRDLRSDLVGVLAASERSALERLPADPSRAQLQQAAEAREFFARQRAQLGHVECP